MKSNNQIKFASSSKAQALTTLKFIQQHGSINRYEAEELGICHLAPRIHFLKAIGFIFSHKDQTVLDQYNIQHRRIRRYWLDLDNTPSEIKEKFAGGAL